MTDTKTGGISVRELLTKTDEALSKRSEHREIKFKEGVLAEIANDSDWHRTRVGYMRYSLARQFQFNGKVWIVVRGEKCGQYPADPYDSDITALEIPAPLRARLTKDKLAELSRAIGASTYFANSLIYAMADGRLAVNKSGRFQTRMLDLVQPRAAEFLAVAPEYDREYLSLSTLQAVNLRAAEYKPEFADFLADSIKAVLSSS